MTSRMVTVSCASARGNAFGLGASSGCAHEHEHNHTTMSAIAKRQDRSGVDDRAIREGAHHGTRLEIDDDVFVQKK
jgi:hypothetical protein